MQASSAQHNVEVIAAPTSSWDAQGDGFPADSPPRAYGTRVIDCKDGNGREEGADYCTRGSGRAMGWTAKHDEADIIRFMKKHRLSRRIWTLSTEQLACYGQEVRPMAFHSETDAEMVRGCVELTRNASPRASDCAAVGPALTTPCIRLLTARHVNPVTCSATASVGLASSAGTLF